jgi:bifunctional non-homologous end joining protein LigD
VLQTYRAKRRFNVTPEPRGTRGPRSGNAFVIQKHAARRLHYDLRLQFGDAMKSWAVTKGPSLVAGEKRLAVHVEDHPIEYNKFEGTIPKGEYGGGTVLLWDRGRWFPEGDPEAGYKKGHLAFELRGKKLSGRWHLVRMRKRPDEKRENWLLIKADDETARPPDAADILEEKPRSVASGRTIDEIAAGKTSRKKAGGGKRVAPRKGAPRRKEREDKKAADPPSASNASRATEISARPGARRAALPNFVPPCLATLSEAPPDDPQWVHEIKFDGYRLQARIDQGKVKLITRRALDWTGKFPTVARALADIPARQALIDGEIVVENSNGVSNFSLLQQALKVKDEGRFVFYAFDLLYLDGFDLTRVPLLERKAALQRLLRGSDGTGTIRYSEHFTEPGPVLLAHACRMSLEGIISKRKSDPYRGGRRGDWLKTKCTDRQEFVVAGYSPSTVDRKAIGALILGYYDRGQFVYAGRTGTGFSHQVARDLFRQLQPLRRNTSPFPTIPEEEKASRKPHWVEPRMVVEVDFHGWTHGDRIRQASFQGVREDKEASEVVRESKATPMSASQKTTRARERAPRRRNAPDTQFTHPDRVYWEDVGVTKQGLADYYTQVWDWMRPHVIRRPLALLRCPEGTAGACFFQKHASAGIDRDKLHFYREPDGDAVMTVDDQEGLLSLVQAGCLELHTRGTTGDHLEECDRLVFDLDPGPGVDWRSIIAAAREVRARLAALDLVSFVKTSGGKGLHIVVPIAYTPWDIVKAFTRSIATSMAGDDPGRYTATVVKNNRDGRIFVDYLRNSREATAVAPYSSRARARATVAAPLAWEELGSQPGPDRYTVLNLPSRLTRLRRDPWADISKVKQRLPAQSRSK